MSATEKILDILTRTKNSLISTISNMENTTFTKKRHNYEGIKTIPSIIHFKNLFMAGVDESDKIISHTLMKQGH